MATSFKIKAVEELRKAKKVERELEATAHAASEENKLAKQKINAERLAAKMARIEKGEKPVVAVLKVVEPVAEIEVAVKPKPKAKAKAKAKPIVKKKPTKAKK
tara:strand:+ start:809 stop:1117 length:309 start_codon:yes stop_codon:yes gene_type:complete